MVCLQLACRRLVNTDLQEGGKEEGRPEEGYYNVGGRGGREGSITQRKRDNEIAK